MSFGYKLKKILKKSIKSRLYIWFWTIGLTRLVTTTKRICIKKVIERDQVNYPDIIWLKLGAKTLSTKGISPLILRPDESWSLCPFDWNFMIVWLQMWVFWRMLLHMMNSVFTILIVGPYSEFLSCPKKAMQLNFWCWYLFLLFWYPIVRNE